MRWKEAPEAAAWRSRGILAARKQVRGVSAMYGHHFRSRQRARAFTRESLFMHLLLEMFLYNLAMIVGGA